jgi:hypothetical protein
MWAFSNGGTSAPISGTLEEKLEFLAGVGFRLAAPFGIEELLSSWPRPHYERPGFHSVLFGLGFKEERPPWRPHCVNMCAIDRECIGPKGSYVRIAEEMKRIAEGSLPIENIRDHISFKENKAWIEFELHGQTVHVDCRLNHDWLDPALFGRFTQLVERCETEKTLFYFNSTDQVAVIGCAKRGALEPLKRAGIRVEKLTETSLG